MTKYNSTKPNRNEGETAILAVSLVTGFLMLLVVWMFFIPPAEQGVQIAYAGLQETPTPAPPGSVMSQERFEAIMIAPDPNENDHWFPNSVRTRTYVTGAATSTYNCFAWALGWIYSPFEPSYFGGSGTGTVTDVSNYMTGEGYTEVTSDGDWDVLFWAIPSGSSGTDDDLVKHAATRSSYQGDGYVWIESKMGANERIVTRLTDLDNSINVSGNPHYGSRVLYFRKD
ncbi:MAG TPA: hypothetical protein PLG59_05535 [bacterium]|nr:hypothetical protein [bacterium]HQO34100.1 hypothetical protein [bacterium]HQQ00537.1 hypothetical protein [bacterium]